MTATSGMTAVVLFAGAGAETQAARDCGLNVTLAINHWPAACNTHQANHPNTTVDCADITQISPRRKHRATVLLASPECTEQGFAKGRRRGQGQDLFDDVDDQAAERSRATMWDPYRFAEAALNAGQPYEAILLENVPEILRWHGWPGWRRCMTDIGYRVQVVIRNAAWHDEGQSRDRALIACTRTDRPAPELDFRPAAPCPRCGPTEAVQVWMDPRKPGGIYRCVRREGYLYVCPACSSVVAPYARPAVDVLDVDRPGEPIGLRRRPLVPNTLERLTRAYTRWGPGGARLHDGFTPTPGSRPADALTVSYYGSDGEAGWPILAPVRTLTTVDRHALLTWPGPEATLEDCGYRMITVPEMQALQGLPADWIWTPTGPNAARTITHMIGNAVPVNMFAAVLRPVLASLNAAPDVAAA